MILLNFIQLLLLALWTLFTVYIIGTFATKNGAFKFTIKVWSTGIAWILLTKIKVEGRENLDPNTHYIFMANHSSYFDIACLFKASQLKLHFIAKDELRTNPFTGYMLKKIDMIFINRSSAQKSTESMRKAISFIKEGRNIAIFPEGTRSKTGAIGPFKRGGFKMAVNTNLAIVPVVITNSAVAWPVSNFNFRPTTVTVAFKPPIPTKDLTEKDIPHLIEQVREYYV
ncbi:MAG: 1-acyl-sn-glycerol-3-phosphate acyltransferase [Bacteroidales bacterium]|nr:1-acyl-sn-glycerol-3-phosphate acyltransferase [Bacteroidales bacterium]NLK80901.1 1-acyl-sn-glycerol-3-phosphate acyltransferase [Bacteroidales bacterium]HPY82505.1 lysophospholipid acyltransferase family protein [Bacteroidales bacterium]